MNKCEKLLKIINESDYTLGNFKFPIIKASVSNVKKAFNFVLLCYSKEVNKYGVVLTHSSLHRNTIFNFGAITNVFTSDDIEKAKNKFYELMKREKGIEIDMDQVNKRNYVDDLYNKLTR